MNNLTIFKNEKFGEIRTILADDNPYFCLVDVCRILEIKNSRDCKERLNEDGVITTDGVVKTGVKSDGTVYEQIGELNFINEPNLYKCIFQSQKPEAKKFQNWIFEEVIPEIRKTGNYGLPKSLPEALRLYADKVEQKEKLRQQITADKPKVLFADAVSVSDGAILIGELAKILKGNGVEIGQNRLFERLRQDGFLIKRQRTDYNAPTQKSMELGLFKIKETAITHSDGHVTVNKTTKVTGKGQQYFVSYFLKGAGISAASEQELQNSEFNRTPCYC
jgi:anti-repressor protein